MLDLTPSEKRIIFIISGILILAGLFNVLGSYSNSTVTIEYSESDSIFSRLSHQAVPIQYEANSTDHNSANKNPETVHEKQKTQKVKPGSININFADESELKKLPRIGPAMAKRIIEYRNTNGPFKTIDELTNIKGIGHKTFLKIKPFLQTIQ
jgi:comEA protein